METSDRYVRNDATFARQGFTIQEFCARWGVLADAEMLMTGIYMAKFFAMVHSSRVVCRRESYHAYWCLLFTLWSFFAMVRSIRVVVYWRESSCVCWCMASMWWSFLQWFTLQELCAGGRVLACADDWHLCGEVFERIHSMRVVCRRESSGMCICLASSWRSFFLQFFTLQEFYAGGRVLGYADAWHLCGEVFARVHSSGVVCRRESSGVQMSGIYVVKFFVVIHSTRVLCRKESYGVSWCLASPWGSFSQWFTLQELCAGGRVLMRTDVWHLRFEVFCNDSLYKSFVQEVELTVNSKIVYSDYRHSKWNDDKLF
jgi:hypothetical protein